MPRKEPDFEKILASLEAEGVRYILVGGLAMVAHGSAYLTADVDISHALDRENVEALARAIGPLGPRLRDLPAGVSLPVDARLLRSGTNFTLETEAGELDLLGDTGAGSFQELWDRSVLVHFRGHAVRVASVADLIRMKKVAGRLKDQLHVMELEALLRILEESPSRE